MSQTSRLIVGCMEYVDFPEFGIENALAKIDTGAYSGSLHCTHISVEKDVYTNKSVLQFVLYNDKNRTHKADTFRRAYIRSATGHRIRRYIITTTIRINGKVYPTSIGVADRKEMKRQVLIGRRFLRENKMLVDVGRNKELDDEKGTTL